MHHRIDISCDAFFLFQERTGQKYLKKLYERMSKYEC